MKFTMHLIIGVLSLIIACQFPLLAAPEKTVTKKVTQQEEVSLKSGEWMPVLEHGPNLFPAFALSTVQIIRDEEDSEDSDPRRFGDYWSNFGIAIRAPSDNCNVDVEINSHTYIKPSVINVILPQNGMVYWIFPPLKYEYEKLLEVKQNIPDVISFKVTINGKVTPEAVRTVQVRPVSECIYAYKDALGNYRNAADLFAAYVNENHPQIDIIIKETLKSQNKERFAGYQKNTDEVLEEIEMIWETLSHQDSRYTTASPNAGEEENIAYQNIRKVGESLATTQANAFDSSVLLVSILQKIGLNASLVTLPGHMLVAVDLDKNGKETVFIETTLIGVGALSEALEAGMIQYEIHENKFHSEKKEDWDYQLINIPEARKMGIIPIKE